MPQNNERVQTQANYDRWLEEEITIKLSRRQLIAIRDAAEQVANSAVVADIEALDEAVERLRRETRADRETRAEETEA